MTSTNISKLAIAACGLLAGVVLVVSCSDDSPGDADAAACDCPAAEPPLNGRIVAVRASNPIQPGTGGGQGASCPAGAIVLGGACEVMTPDRAIQVSSSRVDRSANHAYVCEWSARDATVANTGTAEAICLVPAQ
ncbi:MAG: hypothetical protein KBG48_10540 [Kofleriaceae bacterium]|jgi:hypothetical protein|nr:hypothetical protein [Kofleriaceae bacterium]MBP9167818.1 hypothetical protein [Kofleriaceae bacterium]MBP9863272.1 hypothetical protein [Kofleriaceae bacterium]